MGITNSDRIQTSFDGPFAKIFIACCKMEDMGKYKCHCKNDKGEDSTEGKVTVKPAPKAEAPKEKTPEPEPAPVPERKKTYKELQEEEKARKAALAPKEEEKQKRNLLHTNLK